ncbi:hypothetical protein CHS0354_018407 [Potamilus streckersoni]|uniref:Uncharacterized protein n=1 Tax=Potamilus streckersoni TaxID=2493646 RepID=A0AAE0TB77_9BIVA|nr:hypothetical protein CHS0354_018407 [Potamilus streckersoni]
MASDKTKLNSVFVFKKTRDILDEQSIADATSRREKTDSEMRRRIMEAVRRRTGVEAPEFSRKEIRPGELTTRPIYMHNIIRDNIYAEIGERLTLLERNTPQISQHRRGDMPKRTDESDSDDSLSKFDTFFKDIFSNMSDAITAEKSAMEEADTETEWVNHLAQKDLDSFLHDIENYRAFTAETEEELNAAEAEYYAKIKDSLIALHKKALKGERQSVIDFAASLKRLSVDFNKLSDSPVSRAIGAYLSKSGGKTYEEYSRTAKNRVDLNAVHRKLGQVFNSIDSKRVHINRLEDLFAESTGKIPKKSADAVFNEFKSNADRYDLQTALDRLLDNIPYEFVLAATEEFAAQLKDKVYRENENPTFANIVYRREYNRLLTQCRFYQLLNEYNLWYKALISRVFKASVLLYGAKRSGAEQKNIRRIILSLPYPRPYRQSVTVSRRRGGNPLSGKGQRQKSSDFLTVKDKLEAVNSLQKLRGTLEGMQSPTSSLLSQAYEEFYSFRRFKTRAA